MKSLMFFFMIISCNIYCFSQPDDKVIAISHFIGGGDTKRHLIIGSNKQSIEKEYRSFDLYTNALYVPKIIVRRQVLRYLSRYIKESCNKVNNINASSNDFFSVAIGGIDGETICYLENKDTSIGFFTGFRKWILKSVYRKECEKILLNIEPFCRR